MSYDYVILDTSYTSRIPFAVTKTKQHDAVKNYFEEVFEEWGEESQLVFIKDTLWGKEEAYHLYGEQADADFITAHFKYDGIVVFKNLEFGRTMSMIDVLQKLNYCVGCYPDQICQIVVEEMQGKKILYMKLDTSSG